MIYALHPMRNEKDIAKKKDSGASVACGSANEYIRDRAPHTLNIPRYRIRVWCPVGTSHYISVRSHIPLHWWGTVSATVETTGSAKWKKCQVAPVPQWKSLDVLMTTAIPSMFAYFLQSKSVHQRYYLT